MVRERPLRPSTPCPSLPLLQPRPLTHFPYPRASRSPQERAQNVLNRKTGKADGDAAGAYMESTRESTVDVVFCSINEPYRLVLSDIRETLAHTK